MHRPVRPTVRARDWAQLLSAFAVVAAEVRNLAQRSAGAAGEIKDLIEAPAGKVEAAVAGMEQAVQQNAAPAAIRVQPALPAAQLLRVLAARGTEKYAGAAGQKES